jgi:hypothetical protein
MRLANRTKEVEFFKQMLLGQISKRILLIKSASGMGKTSLLDEFAAICPAAIQLAQIDLRGATNGITFVCSRLQRQIGEDNFTRFNDAINTFLNAGVEVSGNNIKGTGNQINVFSIAESKEFANIRFDRLQKEFFCDLRAIEKPIVIILDTFELAPTTLKNWIGGDFLEEVAKAKNIWVVIAGQSVPEPKIGWRRLADTHCLDKIDDIDVWHSFLHANGLLFERETVEAFVLHLDGQPSDIVKAMQNVDRRRRK